MAQKSSGLSQEIHDRLVAEGLEEANAEEILLMARWLPLAISIFRMIRNHHYTLWRLRKVSSRSNGLSMLYLPNACSSMAFLVKAWSQTSKAHVRREVLKQLGQGDRWQPEGSAWALFSIPLCDCLWQSFSFQASAPLVWL